MAHITIVTSALGGVGKSYVSALLSNAFANKCGRRVLLLDLNHPFGTLEHQLGLTEEKLFDLGDVLSERSVFDSSVIHFPSGFDFLPASSGVEPFQHSKFKHLLNDLSEKYDQIVVDAPSKGIETFEILFSLNAAAIAVTTLSPISICNTAKLSEIFSEFNSKNSFLLINGFQADKKGLVPNLDAIINKTSLQLIGITPIDNRSTDIWLNNILAPNVRYAFERIAMRLCGNYVPLPDLYKL